MILEEAVSFLRKVPPFQFLDDGLLQSIAPGLSLEFYPKDTFIHRQNGPPSQHLGIIKKGAIKVFVVTEDGEEMVIDYRGEGDTFGFLSLIGKDRVRSNMVAMEDTITYLLNKEAVHRLLAAKPEVNEFFLKAHLAVYIDKTYKEMHSKSLFYGGSDRLLFTTQVGELAATGAITSGIDVSIQDAARIMVANRVSSLVITDNDGKPVGMVTDRDLRKKVVADGLGIDGPITAIMSRTLIWVESRDFCFEAVLKMIRHNVHHILVMKEGRLQGVVTNHDFMMLQGTSPLSFAKFIENQEEISGLVPVSMKINRVIGLLLKEGAKACNITKIISELNDRLVKKVLQIAEKKIGPPPVPYCWISYGSEGRNEQTFRTDQDNGLIFQDVEDPALRQRAEEYFTSLSIFVRDALITCGFPSCPGNYMASNPAWRQPLSVWKNNFARWINTPTSEAILSSVILFDFRGLAGDLSLAGELRAYLSTLLHQKDLFLKHMANMVVSTRPPLGFFKTFIVEKDGEHKHKLNMKNKCIAPLINIVRLFSLEAGIAETSTMDRIEALRASHPTVQEFGTELAHAFEFIMLLRILHQSAQIGAGQEPDNFIDPEQLSNLEKNTLKDTCKLISKIQELIVRKYSPGSVM